jgi:glyoxylase-like metal-dependent hydrolase (beta-lactamase superfamily II)
VLDFLKKLNHTVFTMKANTTKKETFITRLILTEDFSFPTGCGSTTYKKGRVIETIRNKKYHYYPSDHFIVLGHGWNEKIPAEIIKAKWLVETKTIKKTKTGTTTKVSTKEIKVK